MKAAARKTRFVPQAVFRTAFASVVPVCVASSACGGADAPQNSAGDGGKDHSADAAPDRYIWEGVGCSVFSCGVAAQFADAQPDSYLWTGVACIGFDGGPCGYVPEPDATAPPDDGGDASDSTAPDAVTRDAADAHDAGAPSEGD